VYVFSRTRLAIEVRPVIGVASVGHDLALKAKASSTANAGLDGIIRAHANKHEGADASLMQPAFEAALGKRVGNMLVHHVFGRPRRQSLLKLSTRLAGPKGRTRCARQMAYMNNGLTALAPVIPSRLGSIPYFAA